MTRFVAGRPLRRKTPVVVVDAGLPPGRHRFSLVVTDASGQRSRPDVITVVVRPLRQRAASSGT